MLVVNQDARAGIALGVVDAIVTQVSLRELVLEPSFLREEQTMARFGIRSTAEYSTAHLGVSNGEMRWCVQASIK